MKKSYRKHWLLIVLLLTILFVVVAHFLIQPPTDVVHAEDKWEEIQTYKKAWTIKEQKKKYGAAGFYQTFPLEMGVVIYKAQGKEKLRFKFCLKVEQDSFLRTGRNKYWFWINDKCVKHENFAGQQYSQLYVHKEIINVKDVYKFKCKIKWQGVYNQFLPSDEWESPEFNAEKPDIDFIGGEHKEKTSTYYTNIYTYNSKFRLKKRNVTSIKIDGIEEDIKEEYELEEGRRVIKIEDRLKRFLVFTIIIVKRPNGFGNRIKIQNSYRVTSYYTLTLPDVYFNRGEDDNIAGTYNFLTYDEALKFACQKEEKYRVLKAKSNEWFYISISNKSVTKKYTKREELDMAIKYYAKQYIKNEKQYRKAKTAQEDGKAVVNDTVDNKLFIRQNIEIPKFLNKYKNLSIYKIQSFFVFSFNSILTIKQDITIKYIADDYKRADDGATFEYLDKNIINKSISDFLKEKEHLKQGYYLITEKDKCLNKEEYIVYLDLEQPTLKCDVTKGDKTEETILHAGLPEIKTGSLRFVELNIKEMLDNVDTGYLVLEINGRGIDRKFDSNDEIPVLKYENGYWGKYSICVYDRGGNKFAFDVSIAGQKPTLQYSSLSEKTKQLYLKFQIHDQDNVFVEISLFKVKSNGDLEKILEDADGTAIDFRTLDYVIRKGGKYQAKMVDLYGRVVYSNPFFYMRGLPFGRLSIDNQSYTNKTVTFTHLDKFAKTVYILSGTNKMIYEGYRADYDETAKLYTLTFIAEPLVDKTTYLIKLYDKDDEDLFVEYSFGIDTLIGTTTVVEVDTDEEISKGGATTIGFKIEYTELSLSIKYSKNGAFPVIYRFGDVIKDDGIYTFTVKDYAGNKESFEILIDKSVDYRVQGDYQIINNTYISNQNIEVEVREVVAKYIVLDLNTQEELKNMQVGVEFSLDGKYKVIIEDIRGNVANILIEIDKTPPTIELVGVSNGKNTKNKVQVICKDGERIELYNKYEYIKTLNSGDFITTEGSFRIVARDIAGNEAVQTFGIDRTVDVAANILNNSHTTGRVDLTAREPIFIDIYINGNKQEEKRFYYKEVGDYEIHIKDQCDNVKVFKFSILPKASNNLNLKLYKNTKINKLLKNGNEITFNNQPFRDTGLYEIYFTNDEGDYSVKFKIDSIKPEVKITQKRKGVSIKKTVKKDSKLTLFKEGKQIKYTTGTLITEPGSYHLLVTDEYGNSNEYDFVHKKHINTYGLVALLIITAVILGVIIYALVKKINTKSY